MTFRRLSNESKYKAVANYCSIMEIDIDIWYSQVVDFFVKFNTRFTSDGKIVKSC